MLFSRPDESLAKLDALDKSQAVIEFNLDGTIVTANKNFLSALGYTLDEIKGKHHRMFVDPEDAKSPSYQAFWDKLRSGQYDAGEYKRIGKGGKEVWIQASYNPILDKNGKPIKVVKFATDITAAKLKNADYEGQLGAISKSQAVIEFNMDGTIITANKNFLSALGYTLDEIQGKHHRMFVTPDESSAPAYQAFWDRLRSGHYDAGEYKRIGKGGKEIWIQASYNPIFDMNGKPFKVVKYATDITDAKLKTADFQGQIDAIGKSQAVIEFNMDGTIITANQNFLATMGYTLAEVQGKHHRIFVAPEEAGSLDYQMFWDKLRAGQYDARAYKRIARNGNEVWIQASYNPIFDMNGKPFKVVKYATDITQVVEIGGLSEETSASTQTVAAAIEEMSSSIAEISRSMSMATNSTSDISRITTEAAGASEQLIKTTSQMENIISIINEIAEQTNLLALNATIEAARAGELGKGFAVVASEVKNLAGQTAKATEDVAREIKNVQSASQSLQNNIVSISGAVETVNNNVSTVASAIEEQSAVTTEISSNTDKVAVLVQDITDRIKSLSKAG